MDLTQKLAETEFSQRLRGYDMDEVDQFLQRLAQEVAKLERQLDDAEVRAQAMPISEVAPPPPAEAEPLAPVIAAEAPAATLHDPDGAVQRMLAIAQRTADEAVRESKNEALKVVSEAEMRANATVVGAEEQRDKILAEAASEARRLAEETRRELVDEVGGLEGNRDSLLRDVSLLERHLAQQRKQLGASVARLQQLLEDPESFRIDSAPDTSGAGLPDHLRSPAAAGELSNVEPDDEPDDDTVDLAAAGEALPDAEPEDDIALDLLGSGVIESADDSADTGDDLGPVATAEPAGEAIAAVTDLATARSEVVEAADGPLPEPEAVSPPLSAVPPLEERAPLDGLAPPPAVSPPPIIGLPPETPGAGPEPGLPFIDELIGAEEEAEEPQGAGDRFLDELRKVSDQDDLGPPNEDADRAMSAFFDQDADDPSRSRFGRRS